jgi:AP-3 complex subunit delta-1
MLNDIKKLCNFTKPLVRKKAMILLYQTCAIYPEGLQSMFDAIQERLTDSDTSVVAVTISIIVEHFALTHLPSYLSLTPILLELISKSKLNWMLIKVRSSFCIS